MVSGWSCIVDSMARPLANPALDSQPPSRDRQRMADDAAPVAVITGGAGGIGRALALRLARDGFAIGVLDRDRAGADATVDAVAVAGGRASAVTADVTDMAQVTRAFGDLKARLGPTRVLVNNVGWDVFGMFAQTDAATWE